MKRINSLSHICSSCVLQILGLIVFLLISESCTFIKFHKQLSTLKQLEANQKSIDIYIDRKKKKFHQLLQAIKERKLPLNLSKKEAIDIYGEPVLTKKSSSGEEVFLYRHPLKYSSTTKVYLYFDKDGKLSKFQVLSAK